MAKIPANKSSSSSDRLEDNPLALGATAVFWLAVAGLFYAYRRQKRIEREKVAAGLAAAGLGPRPAVFSPPGGGPGAARPNAAEPAPGADFAAAVPPVAAPGQPTNFLPEAVPLDGQEIAAMAASLRSDALLLGLPCAGIAVLLAVLALVNRADEPLMGVLLFMALAVGGASWYFLGFGLKRSRELPPRAFKAVAVVTDVSSIGTKAGFPVTIAYCIGGVVIKKRTQFQRGRINQIAANGWRMQVTVDSANPHHFMTR